MSKDLNMRDIHGYKSVYVDVNGYDIYHFRYNILNTDFNLSPGCFGTDIIQQCTKWSNIGVHGLNI